MEPPTLGGQAEAVAMALGRRDWPLWNTAVRQTRDQYKDDSLEIIAESTVYLDPHGEPDALGFHLSVMHEDRMVYEMAGSQQRLYVQGSWEDDLRALHDTLQH